MSEPTVNAGSPAEWSPYFGPDRVRGGADSVASHRATTSSRTPGKVNRGTVRHAAIKVVNCGDCGNPRMDLGGAHSPHWRGEQLVDCVGREVVR